MSAPNRSRLSNDAFILDMLMGDSSDEDACVENDSDDGEEDNTEVQVNVSDTEDADDIHQQILQEDLNYVEPVSSDEDEVPLGRLFMVRDKKNKSTMKWKKYPPLPRNVRTRAENIVLLLPGPVREGRNVKSELECFSVFMDNAVIGSIVTATNIYIDHIKQRFARDRDAKHTDAIEMRAFVGILLLTGSLGSNRKHTNQVWDTSKGIGVEACYLAMSENRFHFLMRCIRFDDIRDRNQRREIDRLAPIRDILEFFVQNFQRHYTPSEYCTLDEQLVAFRGKCPFKMYIPKKPARYGIKVFALVCAKTKYTVNLEVYVGTQPDGPYKVSNSSEDVTIRMVEPISGTNRNLTTDNWFTSIPLATKLLEEKKITIVGTLRSNRILVPEELKANKEREVTSSIFAFHKKKTLVSYCPKKKKAVLVLSTMHHDDAIDEDTGEAKKPEMVTFYNKSKVGVDVVDQMCAKYNVARNTKRWPMVLFFDLLNIAGINAYILHNCNHQTIEKPTPRREFLQTLAFQLIKPQIESRLQNPYLPVEMKRRAKSLLGVEETPQPERLDQQGASRGRCYLCGRVRDKTSRKKCGKCGRFICVDHSVLVCTTCLD